MGWCLVREYGSYELLQTNSALKAKSRSMRSSGIQKLLTREGWPQGSHANRLSLDSGLTFCYKSESMTISRYLRCHPNNMIFAENDTE